MMQLEKKIITTCTSCNSMYKVSSRLIDQPVLCSNCKTNFIVKNPNTEKENTENKSLFLCKIALNYGLLNEKQLHQVLTEYTKQTQAGTTPVIEDLLLNLKVMSSEDLILLTDIRKHWKQRQIEKQVAADAVKKGVLTAEQARDALVKQAIDFKQNRIPRPLKDFLSKTSVQPEADNTMSKPQKSISDVIETPGRKKAPEPDTSEALTAPDIRPKTSVSPEEKPAAEEIVQKEKKPSDTPAQEPSDPLKTSTDKTDLPKTIADPIHEAAAKPPPDVKHPEEAEPQPEDAQTPTERPPTPAPPPPKDSVPADPVPEKSQIEADKQDSVDETGSDMHDKNTDPNETIISIKGLELVISSDNLIALLRAPKKELEITATVDDINAALKEEEIIFGVVENALIQGFLSSKIFREKPFKIAEGRAPTEGIKGNIKYFFDTDHLKIGSLNDSGHIDFKDRGEIPHVSEGDLLAEITPAVIGQNGVDIYGRDLPVPVITEVSLRCEKGTEMSGDLTKVIATTSGQPKLSLGNKISVLSELTIPGDVGFETGHIEFEGNIIIRGTIQSDFTVKGANISAKEILAANVNASGDLTVKDGITGATINTLGSVKAKFINKADIKAFGDIIAIKEIIDTKIENSGACKIERGKIISSEIAAKQGIEALEIGTELSNPNKLKVGVDDHLTGEVNAFDEKISAQKEKLLELRTKMDTLSEEEKETQKKIADLAHIQDRSQLDQKELKKEIETLKDSGSKERISEVEKEIEKLASQAKEADSSINEYFDRQDELNDTIAGLRISEGEIQDALNVLNDEKKDLIAWAEKLKTSPNVKAKAIFAGTAIIGAHSSKTLKETVRNSRIREVQSPNSVDGWEMKVV